MIVKWSTVKMYSQGVFDVWFMCPYCGYESWARAYGVGEGFDGGVKNTASASHAMSQANVMAEHAAVRAVHGSPCPRCGQHHPEVVRWAARGAREEKRRNLTRATARTMMAIGIAAAIGFVVLLLIAHLDAVDIAALVLLAAAPYAVGRLLMLTTREKPVRWTLYARTAPGVTFQTDVNA